MFVAESMERKPQSTKSNNQLTSWVLLLILSVIWGSSFILIKKSLLAFTPLQVGAARVVIAFLAFLPMFFYFLKEIKWNKFIPLAVVGLFGSALPAILYAYAQTEIPSAIAGLLNALTPVFTLLLAVLFFGRQAKVGHFIGILLGFTGTALIFLSKYDGGSSIPLIFGMAIIIATCFYGISANTVNSRLREVKPLIISTVSFVIVGPWMLAYLLTTDFLSVITTHEYGTTSLMALLVLSLVGTFGANILFFKLIQLTDSVFASSVSFITPIIALLWGLWDGETVSPIFLVALLLIFSGIYLVKYQKNN